MYLTFGTKASLTEGSANSVRSLMYNLAEQTLKLKTFETRFVFLSHFVKHQEVF